MKGLAMFALCAFVLLALGQSAAAELEKEFFPQPEWLVDAVHERILPLPGHVTISNQTTAELARRTREGL